MKISQKLILGLVFITSLMAPIGYFAVYQSEQALTDAITKSSATLLGEVVSTIESHVNNRIEGLKILVREAALRGYLTASNDYFELMDDPESYILEQDRKWQEMTPTESNPFMKDKIENEVSHHLRERVAFYRNEYGHDVFSQIVVTNRYGANVAQTGRTTDYYQADEEWWQQTEREGLYVSDVNYDKNAEVYSIEIGLEIVGSEGEFLGVMKAALNIEELIPLLRRLKFETAQHTDVSEFYLINKDGEIILATMPYVIFDPFPQDLWNKLRYAEHDVEIVDYDDQEGEKIYFHSHFKGFKNFRNLGWTLVEEYDKDKVLSPINDIKNTVAVMVMGLVFMGLLIGIIMARSIILPVEKLRDTAVQIGQGNLDVSVDVSTHDELGFLAETFNKMVKDIKEQRGKLVERTLMESLVESIKEGMIMIDPLDRVVIMNPQARAMLGFEEKTPENFQALKEKMRTINLDEYLQQSREENALIQKEVVVPENPKQTLLCNICPVRSDNINVGTAIILRDISKEKDADRTKSEFISTVSHELRTPLAITKEGLSLVLDRIAGDITEKQEMIISTAQENIARLSRLINNLLDISKIEAGKMEIHNVKLDIVDLTKKVLRDFEHKASDLGLAFKTNFEAEEMLVFADRDKIIQVLTNLINNALKFTNEGHIEVSARSRGDFYQITVADTGVGISKENLKKTFGRFQQFDRIASGGEKGTGLGLSIAKGIVDMHKGKIWVESLVDVGTKFHFTLRKFHEHLLLQDVVENKITNARRSSQSLSMVSVDVNMNTNNGTGLPEEEQIKHLKTVEGLINADLHRDGDKIFRHDSHIVAFLVNCDKKHAGVVNDRIRRTLDRFINQEKLENRVRLNYEYATYPEDGENSLDLIKKLRISKKNITESPKKG